MVKQDGDGFYKYKKCKILTGSADFTMKATVWLHCI